MKQHLKQQMEAQFEEAVKHAYSNNPMKGTPLEGMTILTAIGRSAKTWEESLKAGDLDRLLPHSSKIGLSDAEIEEMVDEVSTKITNKYLEYNTNVEEDEDDGFFDIPPWEL